MREGVVIAISGHRTRNAFDRFNITSAEDQRETMKKVTSYHSTQ